MKQIKFLNVVLSVIATCLILITLAVTGMIPSANANNSTPRYISVPINSDGSINVKVIGNPVSVDVVKINGNELFGKNIPISLNEIDGQHIGYKALPINLEEVDGKTIRANSVPVVLEK